jgi:hypothetical protein
MGTAYTCLAGLWEYIDRPHYIFRRSMNAHTARPFGMTSREYLILMMDEEGKV